MTPSFLVVADEVREALDAGRGVVALESSLIAQGLPVPHNLQTAVAAEAAVREAGAVPATVAVEDGRSSSAPITPCSSGWPIRTAKWRRPARATSGRSSRPGPSPRRR